MESVEAVESDLGGLLLESGQLIGTNQKVVEANLLLFQEDKYGKGVAADAENSEYEHEETCTKYGLGGCYL